MGHYSFPGIYIENGLKESNINMDSFATVFLSFVLDVKTETPIILKSILDMGKYDFFENDLLITQAIRTYFANDGKKLYIIPQRIESEHIENSFKYENYLASLCDNLEDVETIVAIDIFENELFLRSGFSVRDTKLYSKICSKE